MIVNVKILDGYFDPIFCQLINLSAEINGAPVNF